MYDIDQLRNKVASQFTIVTLSYAQIRWTSFKEYMIDSVMSCGRCVTVDEFEHDIQLKSYAGETHMSGFVNIYFRSGAHSI